MTYDDDLRSPKCYCPHKLKKKITCCKGILYNYTYIYISTYMYKNVIHTDGMLKLK